MLASKSVFGAASCPTLQEVVFFPIPRLGFLREISWLLPVPKEFFFLRLLGLSRPLGVLLPIVVVLFLPLHALVSPPGALGVSPFPSLLELSPSLLELSPSLLELSPSLLVPPLGLRFLLLLMPLGLDLP